MGVVGAALRGFGRALKRKGKVAPTIKSVKPTTDISGSVKRVKQDEYRKRYTALDKAEEKVRKGKRDLGRLNSLTNEFDFDFDQFWLQWI